VRAARKERAEPCACSAPSPGASSLHLRCWPESTAGALPASSHLAIVRASTRLHRVTGSRRACPGQRPRAEVKARTGAALCAVTDLFPGDGAETRRTPRKAKSSVKAEPRLPRVPESSPLGLGPYVTAVDRFRPKDAVGQRALRLSPRMPMLARLFRIRANPYVGPETAMKLDWIRKILSAIGHFNNVHAFFGIVVGIVLFIVGLLLKPVAGYWLVVAAILPLATAALMIRIRKVRREKRNRDRTSDRYAIHVSTERGFEFHEFRCIWKRSEDGRKLVGDPKIGCPICDSSLAIIPDSVPHSDGTDVRFVCPECRYVAVPIGPIEEIYKLLKQEAYRRERKGRPVDE